MMVPFSLPQRIDRKRKNNFADFAGCWTTVMRRQGGRSNPHQPLTSNDVYPQ